MRTNFNICTTLHMQFRKANTTSFRHSEIISCNNPFNYGNSRVTPTPFTEAACVLLKHSEANSAVRFHNVRHWRRTCILPNKRTARITRSELPKYTVHFNQEAAQCLSTIILCYVSPLFNLIKSCSRRHKHDQLHLTFTTSTEQTK